MLNKQDQPFLLALFTIAVALFLNLGASFAAAPSPNNAANSQITQESNAESSAESREAGATEVIANYTIKLAWLTGVLAAVGIATSGLGLWQILLARAEFTASHRPIIKVRAAVLDRSSRGTAMRGPRTVSGRFIVANMGGTAATITGSHIELCWSDHGIPVANIYETMPGGTLADKTVSGGPKISIRPGYHLIVPFENKNSTVAIAGTGRFMDTTHADITIIGDLITTSIKVGGTWPLELYLFGWIRFTDNNHIERQMGFCRMYNSDVGRFVPMSDTDLEYEA